MSGNLRKTDSNPPAIFLILGPRVRVTPGAFKVKHVFVKLTPRQKAALNEWSAIGIYVLQTLLPLYLSVDLFIRRQAVKLSEFTEPFAHRTLSAVSVNWLRLFHTITPQMALVRSSDPRYPERQRKRCALGDVALFCHRTTKSCVLLMVFSHITDTPEISKSETLGG